MPQFSVIIPAFNSAATIAATLESVLAQTFSDYEIIVVDDGSTDQTTTVLARYVSSITLITQQNHGLSGARNAGARVASGEWLALLDADDSWTPSKLRRTATAISANPDAVMFFSDANCFDLNGVTFKGPFMPSNPVASPTMDDMMAGRFQILPSSAVISRDAYTAVGGFSEKFRGASGFEDVFFWLGLREVGYFSYIPEKLVNYRLTPLHIRLERYRPGFKVFSRLVQDRYAADGKKLVRIRRRARVNLWRRAALMALESGDIRLARRAFGGALREDPVRIKNLLSLLGVYLPRPSYWRIGCHRER
jgi:glycosyltransferase involved in cell wall biosynthesis